MRRVLVGLLGLTVAGLGVAVVQPAFAGNTVAAVAASDTTPKTVASDNLPNPLDEKRSALREQAISGVLSGRLTPQQRGGSTVVDLGAGARGLFKDRYVELQREKTDKIFVILTEFGDQRSPNYPDQDTNASIPGPTRFDGPLHNQIPQPDRSVDNSTVWQADYSQQHFQDLYFGPGESLKHYYEAQSSGRYSVDGVVTDWVKVPFNEARYGRSNGFPCASQVCSNTWALVRDAANKWVADQLAQGRSLADVTAEVQSFDQWDRYDYDGDGNFNEPDGYIDHFQIVHAGGDQADGDPIFGEDAIWSHRWYAFQSVGVTGPPQNLLGGTQIGNTGVWIGDYTIQPENGGRSVFYHEYGHDLGLPDDYNILSGGDNNSEYWTLMAQSRLGAKTDGGIGERGGDLGAWNKLQLGWLDYATVNAGQRKTLELGPEEYNSKKPQALVVVLPKKGVVTELGAPATGAGQWYSGDGNMLNNTMTRQVTLPDGPAALTFNARWDIEDCGDTPCDYAYVEASLDGTTWDALPGNIATASEGNGINGTQATYTPATFDLSAYAGKTFSLRFRYATDPAAGGNDETVPNGIFIDDIAITSGSSTVLSDGAESGTNGWTAAGFAVVGSSVTNFFDNFYIAGNRTYVSYDQYLKTGPYFFGYASKPDFVDHFSYQTGLLISYWDLSYSDNDTFAHPGNGRNLYIDSHPQPFNMNNGNPFRSRVQIYDAPFGLFPTESFDLHVADQVNHIQGHLGQPLFDDTKTYWYAAVPNQGVKLPAAGVKIRVLFQLGTSMIVSVS